MKCTEFNKKKLQFLEELIKMISNLINDYKRSVITDKVISLHRRESLNLRLNFFVVELLFPRHRNSNTARLLVHPTDVLHCVCIEETVLDESKLSFGEKIKLVFQFPHVRRLDSGDGLFQGWEFLDRSSQMRLLTLKGKR